MNPIAINRALISVSDKTGLTDFARRLMKWNIEIISTGGTFTALRDAGIHVTSVSAITGFPEILDGRVKTLHPNIHGGLLGISDNPVHTTELDRHGIRSIDLIVVNLYPFEATVSKPGVAFDEAIEQIDIGGPAMLRSAAKNFKYKTVVINPEEYPSILSELEKNNGSISEEIRFSLAQKVFSHTARYDAIIANYLSEQDPLTACDTLPGTFALVMPKQENLRYGENPHQKAALYGEFGLYFKKIHGKDLSYNNIVDLQSAAEVVEEFDNPTAVIVKHNNPCGVGSAPILSDAYQKAVATDPMSAFGGIVVVNRQMDLATAQLIDKIFTEVIIAPEFSQEVLTFLMKKKDRRIVQQLRSIRSQQRFAIKQIAGGMLLQSKDDNLYTKEDLRVVTRRAPTTEEREAMEFGWRVAKHVRSNAIVYARPDRTIGIGAGQMSRLDSSRIAVMKAREAGLDVTGTAVASDAFFPFADGLLEAVKAGATAVIQPGGSVRDQEVIDAANDHNIAMIFTGMRHFKH